MLLPNYYNYPSLSKPIVAYHLVDCDPFVAACRLVDRGAASSHLWYFIGDRYSKMELG